MELLPSGAREAETPGAAEAAGASAVDLALDLGAAPEAARAATGRARRPAAVEPVELPQSSSGVTSDKGLKLLSWNINGIRSVFQDPAWSGRCKNYAEFFRELGSPDIICFQETKVSRSSVGTELGLVEGYDAYYSFNRGKSGSYCGVATYVRQPLVPVMAEDGFLGIICARKASALTEGAAAETSKNIGGGYAPDSPWWRDLSLSPQEWREIDSEGRCLVLDFQRFVLFNVYAPHESGVERRSFKMKFYRGLEARVRSLLDLDREVVLVGDLNVCRTPLDHCDPERSIRENELTEFGEHPARQWIHEFLTPGGPMVDLYRHFHPTQKGAFTCWNTLIDARRGNYGTRIDYIIVSPGLLPSLKECNVDQAVMGSDHCPVSARFHERIRVEGGQDLDLLGSLLEKSFECKNPPPLCCAHYDELSGKQQTIRKFLEQKASAAFTPFSEARKVVPSSLARPAAAQHSKKKAPRKAPGGGIAAHQKAITSFFASVVSTGDVTNLPGSGSPCNSTLHAQPLLSDAQPTPVDLTPTRSAAALLGYDQPEPAAGADSRPAAGTESPPKSAADESTDASISAEGSQSCSAATSQALHFAAGCPDFSIEEAVPVSTTASSTASKSAWESIFKPPEVPLCLHKEPCIKFRVNKKGPNQGRYFYMCARAVGPSPAASSSTPDGGSKKMLTEHRCNFFKWQKQSRKARSASGHDADARPAKKRG